MKERTINIAIQVLPVSDDGLSYEIVDEAIKVIADSGLPYRVCPFETVVECTLNEALDLVKKIQYACGKAGALQMMTYLKIQADFTAGVSISDKMDKYDNF
jgi:uncharacterized protein YqgV (UPF0045/DUF77 family)